MPDEPSKPYYGTCYRDPGFKNEEPNGNECQTRMTVKQPRASVKLTTRATNQTSSMLVLGNKADDR